MNFKIKNIIFVLFLCYMTLIWDIPIPVLKSIILMLIAIGAVVAGFVLREKNFVLQDWHLRFQYAPSSYCMISQEQQRRRK